MDLLVSWPLCMLYVNAEVVEYIVELILMVNSDLRLKSCALIFQARYQSITETFRKFL